MALPPRPRKRFEGRFAAPARLSTPERLRRMTEEHEREERPFDPERRGTWRGKAHELVLNPGDFYRELRELSPDDEAFEKAKEILDAGGRPDHVMSKLNKLLDFHGVEAFPSQKFPHPDFLYLNSGDTYNATLIYSYDEDKYFVSTFGDIVEASEPGHLDDAWESWIRSEVESCVRRDIENDIDRSEGERDGLLEQFEEFDDAELRKIFEESVRDVKNAEIVHESDGSVFVTHMREVCSETADRVIMRLVSAADSHARNARVPFRVGDIVVSRWFKPGHPAGLSTDTRAVVREVRPRDKRMRVERDDGRQGSWWLSFDEARRYGDPE